MRHKRGRNRKSPENLLESGEQSHRLSQILDIPSSALAGLCQIAVSGNQEAVIDGCRGVLEYDENVIKLATDKMSVRFTGRGLQIKVLTHSSAVVEGYITSIEFVT